MKSEVKPKTERKFQKSNPPIRAGVKHRRGKTGKVKMSELSSTFKGTQGTAPCQEGLIENITNDLQRLNQTVRQAVEAGVSVELVRSARHHGGSGNWGDLMAPVIKG